MKDQAKEGAGRPLPIAVPKNLSVGSEPDGNAGAGAAPQPPECDKNPCRPPEPAPAAHWVAAAVFSYPLAYLYVRGVLFHQLESTAGGWVIPLFAVLFLLGVELFARADRRTSAKETPFWAVCWLAQSVALPLWGWQGGGLSTWQFLLWHAFAVWYVLARTNMLAEGRTGSLLFLDAAAGGFTLPWSNIVRRILTLVRGAGAWLAAAKRQNGQSGRGRRLAVLAASAAAALLICLYAETQLAAADPGFAALSSRLSDWLRVLWRNEQLGEFLVYGILSLPVGAWLFGLVAGGLRRQEAPITAERFFASIGPWQRLPAVTVVMVLGALCAMYGLFFALQAAAFAGAVGSGLTARRTSALAVDGFWELCRVLLLDFGLLACIRFFGPALRQHRGIKLLQTVFAAFGVAFALLAGGKLGLYIGRYGWTPRRALSGWFLAVLAVWAVLALVWTVRWPFARTGAARVGIAVLAAGFTLLCCVNMNGLVLRANLAQYAAGRIELDAASLRACGAGSYRPHGEEYAALLAEAGWFEGRSPEEIGELYPFKADALPSSGTGSVQILPQGSAGDSFLVLEFENRVCTRAFTAPRAFAAQPGLEAAEQTM